MGARRSDILGQFLVEAVLLSLLGGVLGAIFGLMREDHGASTTSSSAARARAFPGSTGGGAGARTGGFGAAAGGGAVTGTVKLVDGKNVYVTDADGNVVKVATSAGSQLTKTDPATTKDVAPGEVVIVRGTRNGDGSYTASTLVLRPTSAWGGPTATQSG